MHPMCCQYYYFLNQFLGWPTFIFRKRSITLTAQKTSLTTLHSQAFIPQFRSIRATFNARPINKDNCLLVVVKYFRFSHADLSDPEAIGLQNDGQCVSFSIKLIRLIEMLLCSNKYCGVIRSAVPNVVIAFAGILYQLRERLSTLTNKY